MLSAMKGKAAAARKQRRSVAVYTLVALTLSASLLSTRSDSDEPSVSSGPLSARDGQHDFDFEFGAWHAHLKRRLHPLQSSNEWVEYDGTSVVRKVWDGKANLGEFNVTNATAHVQGMSLRLYNPSSRQWSIYWASSEDGSLTTPLVGGWTNGRGLFYDQESYQGRMVFFRFTFSDLTPTSFRLEQAISADGGATWLANWIATFARSRMRNGDPRDFGSGR